MFCVDAADEADEELDVGDCIEGFCLSFCFLFTSLLSSGTVEVFNCVFGY